MVIIIDAARTWGYSVYTIKNICDELLVLPYNTSGIAKTAIRLFKDKEFEQYVLDRTERYRTATSWAAIASRHLELYRGE
ncbi:hypothetical protein ES705_41846 [subsurface metagenome]